MIIIETQLESQKNRLDRLEEVKRADNKTKARASFLQISESLAISIGLEKSRRSRVALIRMWADAMRFFLGVA